MATITLVTDAAQDARLAPAFGAKLNLGGNASAAQIKADLIEYMKDIVLRYERISAHNNVQPMPDPS